MARVDTRRFFDLMLCLPQSLALSAPKLDTSGIIDSYNRYHSENPKLAENESRVTSDITSPRLDTGDYCRSFPAEASPTGYQ
jgi:hypothetical protein